MMRWRSGRNEEKQKKKEEEDMKNRFMRFQVFLQW
jgi:hypothetical protein